MARINGEEANAKNALVSDYLAENGYATERVAVMINGEILPKSDYNSTKISDSDEVEIVGFVGGG
ncbi:MAG: sulfur carrier protein ThiS [Oscillospiraceae bacterium]|nr:sulfur carrier protein ThiS [Oscillospiraceae bacterium]